jgi:hypothetical protein
VRRASVIHAANVIVRSLWIRFHLSLILLAVVLIGVLASWLMLRLGLRSMAIRYSLAGLVGYAGFFLGVKVWLRYAETALPPRLKYDVALVEEGKLAPKVGPIEPSTSPGSHWWENLDPTGLVDSTDGEGCLVSIALAVVSGVLLGAVGYLLAEAPVILGEAFVQVALAGALRRIAKLIEQPHWSGTVLVATWLPAFLVIVLAFLAGPALEWHCPTAARLLDAVPHCDRME